MQSQKKNRKKTPSAIILKNFGKKTKTILNILRNNVNVGFVVVGNVNATMQKRIILL